MENKETTPLVETGKRKMVGRNDRLRKLLMYTTGAALIFTVGFLMFNPLWILNVFAKFLGATIMLKMCLACGVVVWEMY